MLCVLTPTVIATATKTPSTANSTAIVLTIAAQTMRPDTMQVTKTESIEKCRSIAKWADGHRGY